MVDVSGLPGLLTPQALTRPCPVHTAWRRGKSEEFNNTRCAVVTLFTRRA